MLCFGVLTLCYIMLCCVILLYIMLCMFTLCYSMVWCAILGCVVLCCSMLWCGVVRCVIFCYGALYHVVLCYIMLRWVVLCYAVLYNFYIMLYCVILCYVVWAILYWEWEKRWQRSPTLPEGADRASSGVCGVTRASEDEDHTGVLWAAMDKPLGNWWRPLGIHGLESRRRISQS